MILAIIVAIALAQTVEADDSLGPQLRELQDRRTAVTASLKQTEPALLELLARKDRALRDVTDRQIALVRVTKPLEEHRRERKESAENLKKAEEDLKKAREALEALAADAPSSDREAKQKEIDKQSEVSRKEQDAVQKYDALIAPLEQQFGPLQEAADKAEKILRQIETEERMARTARAPLDGELQKIDQAQEQLLVDHGRLATFGRHVAPLLLERCVACHNSRVSKGRLNVETYAGVMKGGESGPAIVEGTPEQSLLLTSCQEGTMPPDGREPATADELAGVRQWIMTGAILDAGVAKDAPLAVVAARKNLPAAPATYPAPVPVLAVQWHPTGEWLATSGYREVLLWSAIDGAMIDRLGPALDRIHAIAYTPDGLTMAIASGLPGRQGEARLYDLKARTWLPPLYRSEDEVFAIAFNPEGSKVAAAGADRTVRIFDVQSRRLIHRLEDHADWVVQLRWSPDGKHVLTAARDRTAKVFDVETGETITTFTEHDQPVNVVWPIDNEHALSIGKDRLRQWSMKSGKQEKVIDLKQSPADVARLGDDWLFAMPDHEVMVRSIGKYEGRAPYRGLKDAVLSLAIDIPRDRLAGSDLAGNVCIWKRGESEPALRWKVQPRVEKP